MAMHPDSKDLVTISEAGRRLGLANLRQHKRIYGDFPAGDPRTGGTLYEMGKIRNWYASKIQTPRHEEK